MNVVHEQLAGERRRSLHAEAQASARGVRIATARRLARKVRRADAAAQRARTALAVVNAR